VSAKDVKDGGVIAREKVFSKEAGKEGVVRRVAKCLGGVSRYPVNR